MSDTDIDKENELNWRTYNAGRDSRDAEIDALKAQVEELEAKARLLDLLIAQIKVSVESGLSTALIDDVCLTGNLEVRDE